MIDLFILYGDQWMLFALIISLLLAYFCIEKPITRSKGGGNERNNQNIGKILPMENTSMKMCQICGTFWKEKDLAYHQNRHCSKKCHDIFYNVRSYNDHRCTSLVRKTKENFIEFDVSGRDKI